MISIQFNKQNKKNINLITIKQTESNSLQFFDNLNMYELSLNYTENISEVYERIGSIKLNKKDVVQFDLNYVRNKNNDSLIFIIETIYKNYWNLYTKKTNQKNSDINIIFVSDDIDNYIDTIIQINNLVKVVYESKNLADTDSYDDGTPIGFINKTKNLLDLKDKNVTVSILNNDDIVKNNLNLIAAVGANSKNESHLLELKYNNDSNNDYISLIGKGITFDAGGYALKSSESIRTMRLDKCGAAIVVGVFKYLVYTKAKINLVCVIPLSENILGKNSILPSQVIKSYSGKTVQIDNPDAEGRLVLADSMSYAQDKYKCKEIITIATLTGSITITLGKYMTGLFTNNYKLANNFKEIVDKTGDEVWLLPIHRENRKLVQGAELGDITNSPIKSRHGSSSQAAAFLQEFVLPNTDFIHLDIAGTAVIDNRSSGVMVRGLISYLLKK
ncbi:cytosol aminopeptidase [Spiroplasma corruscae]|uniref:Probable cytosol aminopeptidase n=1 Tax=Spiroplasma corruscae TaxID=216934 RepID=A0A222EQC3_9MOLU|nr:cytosol aminopeptidase [Spiroplasma corruscae]